MKEYSKLRNGTLSSKLESDKKYMILKMGQHFIDGGGIGAYLIYMLNAIIYAVDNSYIPVVDWENCILPGYENGNLRKNVWEMYFEQPCNVGLEEAYSSQNYYLIDDISTLPWELGITIKDYVGFHTMKLRRSQFQKYIRFQREIREEISQLKKEQINNKSIGIIIRGTDYKNLKPMNHYKSIDVNQMIEKINFFENKFGYDNIFVATEDQQILDELKQEYNEKVKYLPAKRYESTGDATINMLTCGDKTRDYRDKQYLISLALVASCPAMILSPCTGSFLAEFMHDEKIENFHMCYDGKYRQKGYIFGSELEMKQGDILHLAGKPLLFYTINTLLLMQIYDITVATTKILAEKYGDATQEIQKEGVKIRFIEYEKNKEIGDILLKDRMHIQDDAICVVQQEHFLHGSRLIQGFKNMANQFDGAYAWGIKNSGNADWKDEILINENQMPSRENDAVKINRKLIGVYLFDKEIESVLEKISHTKHSVTLKDIFEHYIEKEKLIYTEIGRGMICINIKDESVLSRTSDMIDFIETQSGQMIGDAVQTARRVMPAIE